MQESSGITRHHKTILYKLYIHVHTIHTVLYHRQAASTWNPLETFGTIFVVLAKAAAIGEQLSPLEFFGTIFAAIAKAMEIGEQWSDMV
jgi:hypothetical protein